MLTIETKKLNISEKLRKKGDMICKFACVKPKYQNGNMRDYTDLLHLIILNNLENTNAELIRMNIKQSDRLIQLNNKCYLILTKIENSV